MSKLFAIAAHHDETETLIASANTAGHSFLIFFFKII
jgi:hypothetical protein